MFAGQIRSSFFGHLNNPQIMSSNHVFRIRNILFQDCKPDIVAATSACEEVKKSKKFAKILELILLIGNIMNTGTKNAQSVGFDISYLPKVSFLKK